MIQLLKAAGKEEDKKIKTAKKRSSQTRKEVYTKNLEQKKN